MFRRDVEHIGRIILRNLREQGLETPLLQRRLVAAWAEVAGEVVSRYTLDAYIHNQTLVVRLSSPALRTELGMQRRELVRRLNSYVGAQVIADIRFR